MSINAQTQRAMLFFSLPVYVHDARPCRRRRRNGGLPGSAWWLLVGRDAWEAGGDAAESPPVGARRWGRRAEVRLSTAAVSDSTALCAPASAEKK